MGFSVSILETCGLNILLALSVYATFMVGQFSLAQVGFWSIGAYITGMLTAIYGVPLAPALAVAAVVCAAIGILLGYPCLRIRGIYLTMATVAFSEVVRIALLNLDFQVKSGELMIGPAGPLGFRGIPVLTAWPQILFAVLLIIALFAWIERSRIGLAARAIREDETAAACSGIGLVAMKVGMFAFGAAIAAAGGGLYGTYISFVSPDNFGFHMALISIFYVTVGGAGRFLGPVVGAVLLTVLPELLRFLGDFRMVGYGAVILVLTLLFPRGLVGEFFPTLRGYIRRKKPGLDPAYRGG